MPPTSYLNGPFSTWRWPAFEIHALGLEHPRAPGIRDICGRSGLSWKPRLPDARRLRAQVPADLLDAVIDLVGVALGIGRIGVPVRARHVAADAARIDADRLEPVDAVADLAQGADLPGDLVGGDLGIGDMAAGAAAAHAVERRLGEDHVRMVIGAVRHEIADRGRHAVEHVGRRDDAGEIERVGDAEAQQIAIEMHRLVHLVAHCSRNGRAAGS